MDMNTFYSQLGRVLEERTPFHQEGYYLLYDGNRAKFSPTKPIHIEIVTAESFVNTLVKNSKAVISSFASGPDNKDVYVFNLQADEFYNINIYLNTLEGFQRALERNPMDRDERSINWLKYNQGDFRYHLWLEDDKIVNFFTQLADLTTYPEEDFLFNTEDQPIIAFEAGIIKMGYYLLTLRAMQRLITEGELESLNTTEDFIAFASTGNNDVDYSIVMPKTIEPALFAKIFPFDHAKDLKFRELMLQNQHFSVTEYLDYWSDAVLSSYSETIPYIYGKSDLEVFIQMEHLGNALAQECIQRLNPLIDLEIIEIENYYFIYYYIEALHFAGPLTKQQLDDCKQLANRMNERGEDLEDALREINAVINL